MALSSFNQALPWQQLAAGGQALSGIGGDPAAALANLGPLYQQQYQAALGMNTAMYEGVQKNYDQLRSDTDQIYNNIYANMDKRYGDVLGRIAGTNTSNINDIGRNAQALSGQASQQMVSRGLGNTTVQQNMQRAIEADRARETTRSNEAFAQLGAGYADRMWQDRTSAQQNKAQMMAGLGQAQIGALERVNAGYPDAAMFGSLAQMYGSQAEANKNRKLQESAMQLAGQGVQSSGGYSYSPSPWGSRNPAGSYAGGWGGDSWTGNYGGGGGGGGFYQPQAYRDMSRTIYNPDSASYGGGGDYDPSMEGGGSYDPEYYEPGDSGMSDAYLDEIGYY